MDNVTQKRLTQEYYSKRSKDYDRQKSRTWKSSQGFADEIVAELHGGLRGFGNKLVLEVGVGSGRSALPLFRKNNPQFVGLDLSREMLELAGRKLTSFKKNVDLVLGDGEHTPFLNHVFDAIVCMSTMHYFESQERVLQRLAGILKTKGRFVYGDLTVHELDDYRFLEGLESVVSKAHVRYHKPSEMRLLMETHGFDIVKMKTVSYRKPLTSLIEDKGAYFDVPSQELEEYLRSAPVQAKEHYSLTSNELTLFYTIITAEVRIENV
jgi:ubiquinone/menaquinone biosynthesis C-methylase UbiE